MREVTTRTKAGYALRSLREYAKLHEPKGEDLETVATDFVADLMHLARFRGWDWTEIERKASGHHQAERAEEQRSKRNPK